MLIKRCLYWFDQVQKYNNITISGIEIQLQALKFATMLGHRDDLQNQTRVRRKASFNGEFLFDLDELCENEEDQYKEIVSFEKKLDFDLAYVSIDSNLAARGMLSEAEIVDSIATNNPVEQDIAHYIFDSFS
ncbi:hypothetical protein BpHYR1_050034 [Brachionus plicatilis]|uniref:Uncharacterized protein n=1 Tax=Brachionus plicatilis TaxID=10195 RepID=A0A3M7PZR4_BRAPC|nr:hypothetical protein BpHYR1_050034 [Brachionus plicatilis]